ncbi:hypothetical protein ACOZE3_28230 [Streptomyces cinereoruber]|uniref:hypothetical protein n=1 Tax=Streptomyces cinereoruber TaxID=67260 RepID=UPI003BF47D02
MARDRIAGALGKPNAHEQKASATSFVVCRFIARSLLIDLSGNPSGTLHHPGQVAEVCVRGDLAELGAPPWCEEGGVRLGGPPQVDPGRGRGTEVRYGTSRAGSVQVPLHRTADVDSFPDAHPEDDWEELRLGGKGRRSPLAAPHPKTASGAGPGK